MAVAVVTGASRGLGRALARALAARGWSLVLDARGAQALAELERELVGAGPGGAGPGGAGPVGAGPGSAGPVGAGPGSTGPVGAVTGSAGPVGAGPVGAVTVGAGPGSTGPVGAVTGGAGPGGARLGGVVTALPGDVADPAHQAALIAAAERLGGLDLLVNNASVLGAEPLRPLAEQPTAGFRQALEVNVVAPLALTQAALPLLRASGGAVLNISSDAAVEAYPSWGGYGASKAALDHLSAVLALEEPGLRVWSVDPGDMRTEMYAAAVPDDVEGPLRPLPEQAAVPALLSLLDGAHRSGRYTASGLLEAAGLLEAR
jgi:NAD(P)-dependent dehydrogenase (short-subunit alcohol dehydrogenase family)